jgi:hypothetical protein
MRIMILLLGLACGVSSAETGYVYSGDLNRDGVMDSIKSGPSEMFGNGGGPFVLSLSDGNGGFLLRSLELHPEAVALDVVEGHARLWSYWRSSCCDGSLGVTTLDSAFETQTISLNFGKSNGEPSVSLLIYQSVFRPENRIRFELVENYEPPPPLSGEWGK